MNKKTPNKPNKKDLINYLFIFVGVIIIIFSLKSLLNLGSQVKELSYSEFVCQLEEKNVTELNVNYNKYQYSGTLKDGTAFVAYAPSSVEMQDLNQAFILQQAAEGSLKVNAVQGSFWSTVLNWLPTILMVVMMIFLYRGLMSASGGGGGVMNFGKSKARLIKDENKVKFKDVAGLEEEKQELAEIVDFLKDPQKYTELGARIPKGVLLVGPPGTGKTYISKAIAGEAGVPFFSISGSDFVEMFVGVGASRVRDLFDDAKKNAPCIVFIDEIDAVGRRRGAGIGGGNDEREQTLNQLLVEMDGFSENEGIIVLAATNRPDVLDPAILRPGRFDREVTIGAPDVKGREEVFKVHSKNKPLGSDVNLSVLARRTPGFTPADIENTMNEAALLTARRNGFEIHMDDIEEAITRVIAGPKKTSRIMTEKEKTLTAIHEAGHAIVTRSIPGADPVHQVTIMPRGSAGGFTMSLPEADKYYDTKQDMLNEICILLGGRVAEALYLEDISTGASNDLERATKIAHDMATKYGMTDAIGPINYSDADEVFLGRDFTSKQNYSEDLASKIDKEVRSIIDSCYARTSELLKAGEAQLMRVKDALLEMETLDKDQFEQLFTDSKPLAEIKAEMETASAERKEAEEKEAKASAKRRAAEKKRAEESLRKQMSEGKKIITVDEKGKIVIISNPDELNKEQAEDAENKEEKK